MSIGPLVLLHSLGADDRMWRQQVEHFGPERVTRCPLAPGHGGRPYSGEVSIQEWVEAIENQIDDLDEPFHVVGLSMGGVLALALAAKLGPRVRSLVLADTFASMPHAVAAKRIESISERLDTLAPVEFGTAYVDETITESVDAEVRADLITAIAAVPADAYLAASRMTFTTDNRHLLGTIAAPSLILCGEQDLKTPVAMSEAIRDGIDGAILQGIPAAAHLSNLDNPEAFNKAVSRFIASAESAELQATEATA